MNDEIPPNLTREEALRWINGDGAKADLRTISDLRAEVEQLKVGRDALARQASDVRLMMPVTTTAIEFAGDLAMYVRRCIEEHRKDLAGAYDATSATHLARAEKAEADAAALRAALEFVVRNIVTVVAVDKPTRIELFIPDLVRKECVAALSTTTGADVLDLMRRMAASAERAREYSVDMVNGCIPGGAPRAENLVRELSAVLADYKRLMGGGT